jgi:hypothetical protein
MRAPLVALGDREVVAGLQVHPESGAGAEMSGRGERPWPRWSRACRSGPSEATGLPILRVPCRPSEQAPGTKRTKVAHEAH